jgi:hypothetical protein
MNKHAASTVSRPSLCSYNDLHKGSYGDQATRQSSNVDVALRVVPPRLDGFRGFLACKIDGSLSRVTRVMHLEPLCVAF